MEDPYFGTLYIRVKGARREENLMLGEDGNLKITTLRAVFSPKACALKCKNTAGMEIVQECDELGKILPPRYGGWKGYTYSVVYEEEPAEYSLKEKVFRLFDMLIGRIFIPVLFGLTLKADSEKMQTTYWWFLCPLIICMNLQIVLTWFNLFMMMN